MGQTHRDRVAVITGAARGIGRAFAERMAREGCHVAVADILPAEDTVAAVTALGRKGYAEQCDLARPEDIERFVGNVFDRFGRCDILVNNAAYMPLVPFAELDLATFRRFEAVNIEAAFLLAKAFTPGMVERRWGRIVNITSSTITSPMPNFLAYVTTKMGSIGLVRGLAAEFGDRGITVNAISPGLTRTDSSAANLPPALFQAVCQGQLIKRTEQPEDLCGALVFLTSDDCAFITGQTFNVDGGASF